MSEEPGKYENDLQAISDQLNHKFLEPDPSLDIDLDYVAFEELKRLAGLQLTRLHSGQSIMRQIDSMIKSWRRRAKMGGGSAVQAAHYEDALQQIRIAIFGESLPGMEVDGKEEVIRDINTEFLKFVEFTGLPKKDHPAARLAFEAVWDGAQVLYVNDEAISLNGEFYIKMTDEQRKKYSFS